MAARFNRVNPLAASKSLNSISSASTKATFYKIILPSWTVVPAPTSVLSHIRSASLRAFQIESASQDLHIGSDPCLGRPRLEHTEVGCR